MLSSETMKEPTIDSVKGIKGDVDKSPTTTGFRGRAVRLVAI